MCYVPNLIIVSIPDSRDDTSISTRNDSSNANPTGRACRINVFVLCLVDISTAYKYAYSLGYTQSIVGRYRTSEKMHVGSQPFEPIQDSSRPMFEMSSSPKGLRPSLKV